MSGPVVRGRAAVGQDQLQRQMPVTAAGLRVGEEERQAGSQGHLAHCVRHCPVARRCRQGRLSRQHQKTRPQGSGDNPDVRADIGAGNRDLEQTLRHALAHLAVIS